MLDLYPSDKVVMSIQEMQYTFFELTTATVQDKVVVAKQTYPQPKDFTKDCGMSGGCFLTRNIFKNDGCAEEERARQNE